eukprot:11186954-Lingulodinium_polyedra.AAC.1
MTIARARATARASLVHSNRRCVHGVCTLLVVFGRVLRVLCNCGCPARFVVFIWTRVRVLARH